MDCPGAQLVAWLRHRLRGCRLKPSLSHFYSQNTFSFHHKFAKWEKISIKWIHCLSCKIFLLFQEKKEESFQETIAENIENKAENKIENKPLLLMLPRGPALNLMHPKRFMFWKRQLSNAAKTSLINVHTPDIDTDLSSTAYLENIIGVTRTRVSLVSRIDCWLTECQTIY